ncbi:MAG: hypothetical protein ACKOXO_05840 [Cyanobium sp.]
MGGDPDRVAPGAPLSSEGLQGGLAAVDLDDTNRNDTNREATGREATGPAVSEQLRPRQLHPLPPGLVELYGLLAVLVVLVPEWMASGALFGFREGRRGALLPPASGAWRRLPELRLATMNLAELRLLAQERRLWGYGRDSRAVLTARLLQRLRQRP